MEPEILERKYFIETIFGRCELIPHGMDETPSGVGMGYVQLEGRASRPLAIFRDGEWLDHKLRPFSAPVVGWFSLVREADGKILF